MTRKSKVRFNRFRTYRLTVNPTTRAIRSAILGLAVAGAVIPAAADAACVLNTATNISCNGVFNNTVSYSIDDLTIAVGTSPFAIIDPTFDGDDGIYLTSLNGYVDLTTGLGAVILPDYANGITIYAESITVNSNGSIVSTYGNGIVTDSAYDTTIVSAGAINVLDAGLAGSNYQLTAIDSYSSDGSVDITQAAAGSITAVTTNGASAVSTGIAVDAWVDGTVTVNGAISAISSEGTSFGVDNFAYTGEALVTINSGGVVSAVVGDADGQDAYGVLATSANYNAYINSAGDVTAQTSGYDSVAYALSAYGYDAAGVGNSGTVHAYALGENGNAVGARADAHLGTASVNNSGYIYAVADSSNLPVPGNSYAMGANATSDQGYAGVLNSGQIEAHAYAYDGNADATGAHALGYFGYVDNSGGSLYADVHTFTGNATATAADASGNFAKYISDAYSSTLANANSYYGNASATAVHVSGTYSNAQVNGQAWAFARVFGDGAYDAEAYGVYLTSSGQGSVTVAGDVVAFARGFGQDNNAFATGVEARNYGYMGTVGNSADVYATATLAYDGTARATGIRNFGLNFISTNNSGEAEAYARTGDGGSASAIGLDTLSAVSASTYNTGYVYATAISGDGGATARAYGIYNEGAISANLNNTGHVEAYARVGDGGDAYAYGGWNNTLNGVGFLYNAGTSLIAHAYAGDGGNATAQAAYNGAGSDAVTTNNGLIAAYAYAGDTGAYAHAIGSETASTGANASFTSDGGSTTSAYADVGHHSDSFAQAVLVYADVDGSIDNSGTIQAGAHGTYYSTASATGAYLGAGGTATLTNNADSYVFASAQVTDHSTAYAYGAVLRAGGDAYLHNDGYIDVYAHAGEHSRAYSTGAFVYSNAGTANFDGLGAVTAYSLVGDYSTARATGVSVLGAGGATAYLESGAYIGAESRAGYQGGAYASGLRVDSATSAYAQLVGDVTALTHSGDQGTSDSLGVYAGSAGAATIYNSGSIQANAYAGNDSHVNATAAMANSTAGLAYLHNYSYVVARSTALDDSYAYAYGAQVIGADATVAGSGVLGGVAIAGDNSTAYGYGAYVHALTGDASLASYFVGGFATAGDNTSFALAVGAYVNGAVNADAYTNRIRSYATVGDYSTAVAIGMSVNAGTGDGYAALEDNGKVYAYAGYHGRAYASGLVVDAGSDASAHVGPARFVTQAESGDYGVSIATGLDVDGTGTGYAYNYGGIYAKSYAGYRGYAVSTGAYVAGDTYAGMRNYFAGVSGQAHVGDNGTAHAYGVDIEADTGLAHFYSYGRVAADAYAGDASGTYSAVALARSVDVYSAGGDADGTFHYAVNAFALVGDNNNGNGAFAVATGIDVDSALGTASVTSYADIVVTARAGSYANSIAEGAIVEGYDYASLRNYGPNGTYAYVTDHSQATAIAQRVYASNGDAYAHNYGTVIAHARGLDNSSAYAVGSTVGSNGNAATFFNEGHVEALADTGLNGQSTAIGSIVSTGAQNGFAYMYNFGYSMIAHAYAGDGGTATATASTVAGGLGAYSYNYGLIEAIAGVGIAGTANATGALTTSAGGEGYLYSYGTITADASGLGNSLAQARGAVVDGQTDAYAYIYGSITATASTGNLGTAASTGINVYATTGLAYLYNDGDIYAQSTTGSGAGSLAVAYGAVVTGSTGASLQGYGTVDAQANAGASGVAVAIGADVNSGAGYVDVAMYSFQVDAVAGDYGYAHALGVDASANGDSEVSIYGDSHAYANVGRNGTAIAQGVIVHSNAGYANFYNSGEMNVHATAQGAAYPYFGGTAFAQGASVSGFLDASAYSPGAIYADANSGKYGSATAIGITVNSATGDGYLYNGTGIHAFAHGYYNDSATAVGASVYGYVDATVRGDGNFAAGASSKYGSTAHAVDVTAHNGDAYFYSGSYVTAGADAIISGNALASGANIYGYNDAHVYIHGTVDANASGGIFAGTVQALGVTVTAANGDAYLYVGDHVYAHASGYRNSTVQAIAGNVYGYNDADAEVFGDVRAGAYVSYQSAGIAQAIGMQVVAGNGDATLYDYGHIYAIASANDQGTAQALSVIVNGYNDASAYIHETIDASAQSGDQGVSQAVGASITASNNNAYLYVGGDALARATTGISGTASAQAARVYGYDYADAYIDGNVGAYASAYSNGHVLARGVDVIAHNADAYLYVGGNIYATALANGGAYAVAQGAYVNGYGDAGAYVYGGTTATASSGDNSFAQARGIDVIAQNGDAYLNSGYLYATATAGDPSIAIAQGGYVLGYNNADAYVYGNIDAYATAGAGSQVLAGGIDVIGQNGDAYLFATGGIEATAIADYGVLASAHGAYVNGYDYATARVGGDISAFASAGDNSQASARGIDVIAQNGDGYFYGGSYIYATAIAGETSTAVAQGANVYAYNYATAKLYYGIDVSATALDNSLVQAGGVDVLSQNSDAYLSTGGGIFASANAGDTSTALAHGSYVTGFDDAYAYVGGIINASAVAGDTSTAVARGISVTAQNGDATLGVYYNIYATATAGDTSTAQAAGAAVTGAGYASATVTGNIDAYASAGDSSTATAFGITVVANGGDAYLYTSGDISALAYTDNLGTSLALGAQVNGSNAATAIIYGGFDVYAESGDTGNSTAMGILVNAYGDDAFLAVGAPLYAGAVSGDSGTSLALAAAVHGDKYATALTNGIAAYAYSGFLGNSTAIGITVDADNEDATLHDYYGLSAIAVSGDGGTSVAQAAAVTGNKYAIAMSEGDIVAGAYASGSNATATAIGITVDATWDGAYLGVRGDIYATAETQYAGTSTALGASVYSEKYYASAIIDGTVDVYAYSGDQGTSIAQGVIVTAPDDNAYLRSNGIQAISVVYDHGLALATGATVSADVYAYAVNGGNVYVGAYAGDYSIAAAYGFDIDSATSYAYLHNFYASVYVTAIAGYQSNAHAEGSSVVGQAGASTINVDGHIEAYALAGDYSTAYALGSETLSSAGSAFLYNSGNSVVALAYVGDHGTATAHASVVYGFVDAATVSTGDIFAYAGSGDYSTSSALGNSTVAGTESSYLSTSGGIYAGAVSGYDGSSVAMGSYVQGPTGATTLNGYAIAAYAYSGDQGDSTALGSTTTTALGYGYLYSSDTISAVAISGYQGVSYARGVVVTAPYGAGAVSPGDVYTVAQVGNDGAAYAHGVRVISSQDYASLDASGDITTIATGGESGLSYAYGTETNGYDGADTHLGGSVYTLAYTGDYGLSQAYGSVTNSANGYAYLRSDYLMGTYAVAGYDSAALALGAYVHGYTGAGGLNHGDVTTGAYAGDASAAVAQGVIITADNGYASLDTYGTVYTTAQAGDNSSVVAIGTSVDGPDGANTTNYGYIHTVATGGYQSAAVALGSLTNSDLGSAYLYNYGAINSYAYGTLSAVAFGSAVSGEIDAYTYNGNGIYATAIADDGGAVAIGAQTAAATGDAVLVSQGGIGALAAGYYGAVAIGSMTQAPDFAGTYAYADISALAYAFDGDAMASGSQTLGYVAWTVDDGSISAGAYTQYGDATATGALTVGTPYAALFGDGDIYATAETYVGDATATGAVTLSDSVVYAYNGGHIAANAYTYDGVAMATGAYTVAPDEATFDTEGYLGANATSINGPAVAFGGYTTAYIATTTIGGDVHASAYSYGDYAGATGIYNGAAWSYVYNDSSSIVVEAQSVLGTAIARGIDAYGAYYSYVAGDGDISATATGYDVAMATGIHSETNDGNSYVTLTGGQIDAYAYVDDGGQAIAQGIVNLAGGYGHATVDSNNDITAQATAADGTAFATGIYNYSYTGTAIVDNGGVIYAGAYADGGTAVATGVFDYAPGDEAHVSNSGVAAATASAYDGTAVATGTRALGYYYTTTDNTGDILATADVGDGPDGIAMATGSSTVSQDGDADLYNDGLIGAYAYGGYYARATGAYVSGQYGAFAENHDTVTATAINGGTALATGLDVDGVRDDAGAFNDGLVQAYASGDAAVATGISVTSDYYSASMANLYQVSASAYGDSYAAARGTMTNGYGDASSYNAGTIRAYASSGGTTIAIGSITHSDHGYAALVNLDLIEAEAYGYEAFAYGAIVDGYTGAYAHNDGNIVATATATATEDGYYAMAVGLSVNSDDGDVYVINHASIVANAYGANAEAIGVRMTGYGHGDLYNSGTIAAYGDGMRRAIQGGAYLSAGIVNLGDIIGSVGTGNYNDSLFNGDGGYWVALQSSDFGDGDDIVFNDVGAVIVMPNSAIYMGGYSVDGNAFYNYGTIVVLGDSLIDMGGNYTLLPGANPLAFYNSGTITMLDGHPDDSLTINGDFTGVGGKLNVDLDLTSGLSDRLYITGDAVDPTSQTINIAMTGKPTVAHEFVPIVDVNDAQDGDWVLGNISGVPTGLFYDLDLAIVHKAGTPDQFGLGVEIPGLNAKGLAALGIGPALQSAWHSINGTLFQREGTDREGRLQGFALSGRVFKNDGKLDPDAGDTNLGTADDRKINADTSGGEVGVAYNFNGAWSVGLLLSTQKFDIDTAGGGNSDGDGNGWGVYATWSPGAFYADLIYREMDFDLKANTAAGGFKQKGDTSGWSLEMGYAFTTSSGWKIEPQAQYSSMTIDGLDDITSGWGNWSYQDTDSTRLRLGVAFRKTFVTDEQHSWTPYLSINAVNEMDGDNSFKIDNGTFFGGDDTSGNSTLVELGATGRINNWTLFGGLNFQQGGGYRNTMGGQLGLRYTFAQPAPAPAPVAPPPAKTCADLDDDGDGVNNCDDKCLGSTAGQAVGPDGCPVPLTIDLKGVNFDFDKATLRPDAVAVLDEAVAILGKYPDLKVEVAGHTDSIGTEQYNQGLSERRAKTVYDYLGQHGVDAGRMLGPNGYGESHPIAPNTNEDGSDNPEGRAKNRRTELNTQN